MLIIPDRCTSEDLRGRFRYLLVRRAPDDPRDPRKAFVVYADVPEEVFVRVGKEIPHQTKYWSVIVTCAPEDRERFIARLDELVQDLVREFKRGYPEGEAPPIHVVCHLDEPNPHLHMTVLNFTSSGRHAKFLVWRRDRAWLEALQRYLRAKYGLADPRDPKRRRVVSEYRGGRARREAVSRLEERARWDDEARERLKEVRNREELRRFVNRVALQVILGGEVKDREELVARLREVGFEVPRVGKNYITVAVVGEDGKEIRVRMKGGIYAHDARYTEGNEPYRGEQAGPEEVERLHQEVLRAGQARHREFAERFKPREEVVDRGDIRDRGIFLRVRFPGWASRSAKVVSGAGAGGAGGRSRRSVGVSRALAPVMVFPVRPPVIWRWHERLMPMLPREASLTGGFFSESGVWVRLGERHVRYDPLEVVRALRALVARQEKQDQRQTGREAVRERESELERLVRLEEAELRERERERLERERREREERERALRVRERGGGYLSPGM